uniref:FMRFamide-like neuropeptide FLP8 n=1 Tax=Macrobrachium rosenbergii TaxID=79674 RepID=FAR8_MACRS|nr:RecName: Full=FMRFamide-like neuropeptide FLP8; AltName: Full=VSHNNFLRF-amide [Macrobrachium rosenbergii]
VSHNNFLRF